MSLDPQNSTHFLSDPRSVNFIPRVHRVSHCEGSRACALQSPITLIGSVKDMASCKSKVWRKSFRLHHNTKSPVRPFSLKREKFFVRTLDHFRLTDNNSVPLRLRIRPQARSDLICTIYSMSRVFVCNLALACLLLSVALASPEGIVQINVRDAPYNAAGDGEHKLHPFSP
jgi:hypothetical protein